MIYATVGESLEWVKDGLQNNNNEEALKVLNNIRKRIYNMYSSVDVVPHVNKCLPIEEFCKECGSCDCVFGFVAPNDVGVIEESVIDNQKLQIDTDWKRFVLVGIALLLSLALPIQEMLTLLLALSTMTRLVLYSENALSFLRVLPVLLILLLTSRRRTGFTFQGRRWGLLT